MCERERNDEFQELLREFPGLKKKGHSEIVF